MEDRYLKEEIMEKRYRVTLTDEERAELSSMVSKGKSNTRKLVRARILLLADQAADRAELAAALRALAQGEGCSAAAVDGVRRALVETLLNGDRAALVSALDETLVGLRARFDRAPLRLVVG